MPASVVHTYDSPNNEVIAAAHGINKELFVNTGTLEVKTIEAPRSELPFSGMKQLVHAHSHQVNKESYSENVPTAQVRCYEPVNYTDKLPDFENYICDYHTIGGVPVQLNPSAWMRELAFENDAYLKSYLERGVTKGFDIVDRYSRIKSYDSANYKSATMGPAWTFIDSLIMDEIRTGKYLIQTTKPRCIHSLGAVMKTNGNYRPITDCKQPEGESINNYMSTTHQPFVYRTVDDVVELLTPGAFTATIDISAAYRTVPINANHRQFQGIRWRVQNQLHYLVDTHMCFGLKCAPYVFTQIGTFVTRCMQRRGYRRIINYIDDFICVADTFEECQHMQLVLINLLIKLGFLVSWTKCSSPSQFTRYLGILFDTVNMRLLLPDDKLARLHEELNFFSKRERATGTQIQKLCGIIAHCAKIVRGGRTFSHRLIQLLKGLKPKSRIRLTHEFKLDIAWWSEFVNYFNGSATMIYYNFGHGPWFATDASGTGYGIWAGGDWMAGSFSNIDGQWLNQLGIDPMHGHWYNVVPPLIANSDDNINFWEMIPIWLAIKRWASVYENTHIVAFSDNVQVVHAVNKGHSSNKSIMNLIRCIFWECVKSNVYLTARYIRGIDNIIPDTLSRLSDPYYIHKFMGYTLCCRSGTACRD